MAYTHYIVIQSDDRSEYQEKDKCCKHKVDKLPSEDNPHVVPGQANAILYVGSE